MVLQQDAFILDPERLVAILRGMAAIISHGAEGQHKHLHMEHCMWERNKDG